MKIGRHIYNEKDGRFDGVLNHRADEYLQCLEIDYRRLDDLLNED